MFNLCLLTSYILIDFAPNSLKDRADNTPIGPNPTIKTLLIFELSNFDIACNETAKGSINAAFFRSIDFEIFSSCFSF